MKSSQSASTVNILMGPLNRLTSAIFVLLVSLAPLNIPAQLPAQESDEKQETQSQQDKNDARIDKGAETQSKQEKQKPTPVIDTTDATGWIVNQPTGAMAEFKTPAKPRFVERIFTPIEELPSIKVKNHITAFNNGDGVFVFSYHDLHEAPVGDAITTTLQGAMLGSIANVEGRKLSEGYIQYTEQYKGIAFEFRYAQGGRIFKGNSRCLLIEKRLYQITGIMLEEKYDQKIVDLFLNSFRLIKPEPEKANENEAGAKSNAKSDPLSGSDAKASPKKSDEK